MSFVQARAAVIGFILALVVLLVSAVVSYRQTLHLREVNERVSRSHAVLADLEGLLSTLKDAETGQRGYVITGAARYLEPYDAAMRSLDERRLKLRESIQGQTDLMALAPRLEEQIDRRIGVLRKIIDLRRDGTLEQARVEFLRDDGKEAMDQIRQTIAAMSRIERANLEETSRVATRSFTSAVTVNSLMALLTLSTVLAAGYLLFSELAARRRAEEAANAEKTRLLTTLTSIGDAVIVTDHRGHVTLLNPVAQELTGWRSEALGQPIETVFRIVNESTRATVENPVERVLREGQIVGLANHTVLIAKDGTERPIDDSGAPVRDSSGRIAGVVLVFRDISERKQAENELRQSEARFRQLADAMPQMVWVTRPDGYHEYYNRKWYDYIGCSPEDCVGHGWNAPLHEEDRPRSIERWNHSLTTGDDYEIEYRFRGRDGQYRWFLGRALPVRNEMGEIIQWYGTCTDIDEQKRSVEALELSQGFLRTRSDQLERLAAVAKRLNSAVDVESLLGMITQEARALVGAERAVTGLSADCKWEQALHAVSVSFDHTEARDQALADAATVYALVCQTNAPLRLSRTQLEEHAAWRELAKAAERETPPSGWMAAPLMNGEGANIGLIQLSDKGDGGEFGEEDLNILTQLAQMASTAIENARLYQQLRDASRRKDEFLAMLGHELRNPLAGIVTGVQVLRLRHAEPDDDEITAVIERQANLMTHMVDDLLDVSRISRGKLTLRRERLDLSAFTRRAVSDYQRGNQISDCELSVEVPSEPVWVVADGTRLAQTITNLVHNACKFCDGPNQVVVRLEVADHLATLSIRDRGIGMTTETLDRIFEPFNQAESSIDRSRGGLGLGLALVRGLIELHGGNIRAASQGLGHGSEFTIQLPLSREPSPDERPAGDTGGERPIYRVLLIDDRRDAILPLRVLLQMAGHEVHVAGDGTTGLEVARQSRPDIILCDIGLPGGMNGYDLARAIRADAELAGVYLVAVSGYGQEEDRRIAQQAGFDYHLTKPVAKTTLEHTIANLPRFSRLA